MGLLGSRRECLDAFRHLSGYSARAVSRPHASPAESSAILPGGRTCARNYEENFKNLHGFLIRRLIKVYEIATSGSLFQRPPWARLLLAAIERWGCGIAGGQFARSGADHGRSCPVALPRIPHCITGTSSDAKVLHRVRTNLPGCGYKTGKTHRTEPFSTPISPEAL